MLLCVSNCTLERSLVATRERCNKEVNLQQQLEQGHLKALVNAQDAELLLAALNRGLQEVKHRACLSRAKSYLYVPQVVGVNTPI
jgi:hypothetical protein